EGLARILGLQEETLKQTLSKLIAYGVASREQKSGVLCNRRMLRDQEIHKRLHNIRAEFGRKGGKQKSSNALASATSSSSSSSSSSDKNPPAPQENLKQK